MPTAGKAPCRTQMSLRTRSTRADGGCDYRPNLTVLLDSSHRSRGTHFLSGRLDHSVSNWNARVNHSGSRDPEIQHFPQGPGTACQSVDHTWGQEHRPRARHPGPVPAPPYLLCNFEQGRYSPHLNLTYKLGMGERLTV